MKLAIAHRDRLVREALRRSLLKSRFELVAQAADYDALVRDCRKHAPQLLLVELELLGPQAEQLPNLLQSGAAVIALAPTNAAAGAYEALGHGALALIEPPRLDDSGEIIGAQRLLSKLERLGILVGEMPTPAAASTSMGAQRSPILAIGASTGGPLALANVLSAMPADFQASVLIVQHIEAEFSSGLAEWLGSQCPLPVTIAERGAMPESGKVYLAGPGGHLVLLPSFQFGCMTAQPNELHVPSVDALFLSLAKHSNPGAAAILTGMGTDGVAGMSELRRRGWLTVAQDEGSCVVYGMPRAALDVGAAMQSLALPAIGPALVRHFQRRGQ